MVTQLLAFSGDSDVALAGDSETVRRRQHHEKEAQAAKTPNSSWLSLIN